MLFDPELFNAQPGRDRMALYRAGMSDREIAAEEGVDRSTIMQWRRKKGLLSNRKRQAFLIDIARMELYRAGKSDGEIARASGLHWSTVQEWRVKKGLPPNREQSKRSVYTERTAEELDAARKMIFALGNDGIRALISEVRRKLIEKFPLDIAEDATADILFDVMRGKILPKQAPLMARRYGRHVLRQFSSMFDKVSFDTTLTEDGDPLIDTLVDERSSVWLEEMGATVW